LPLDAKDSTSIENAEKQSVAGAFWKGFAAVTATQESAADPENIYGGNCHDLIN